ncbi:MAG: cell wall metabolism sensor histidine kinase WalK [Nitrospira sp.]|nr:cell wall metabolism sensor histidine kinase WalK [Nitrospira sp.]
MTLSIRWKVALGTLLAVTLGLALAGWLVLRSIEQLEFAHLTEALETRTGLAVYALQEPLRHQSPEAPSLSAERLSLLQAMAQELSRHALARVTVIDPNGRVLADSATPNESVPMLDNHGARPEVVQALATGRGTDIRLSETTGQRLFYLALSLTEPDRHPIGVVRLALPLTALEARIRALHYTLGLAFGVAFAVSVAVSVLLARGLTKPLSDMAAVARQLADGALGQRIRTTARDEVGVLAATLNQMADQLDRDFTALRQLGQVRKDFVANVSHELRTPLTSIKGYVEALLDGAKDDPEEAKRFLTIILKQSDRLNLILEDLLQLSQIESGQVLFKRDAIRLQAVVDRALALIKPLAEKKGHAVTVALPADLPPLLGDDERLGQVLINLLDNAVKYTPPNGVIHIAGRVVEGRDRREVELTVSDTGLGIPEADRPRVFERFYRVDKARSRELGGTGLGLAIVKHIVEGHGGQVWVEGNEPAGSRFVVRLPAASSTDRDEAESNQSQNHQA